MRNRSQRLRRFGRQATRSRLGLLWISPLLLLWLTLACPAEEQRFDLKLSARKPQLGVEWQGTYVAQRTTTETSDFGSGKHETNNTARVELVARWRVTSMTAGSETRELTIERLTAGDGSHAEELAPKGTVVIAKQVAGEKFFSAQGIQLSVKARQALASVVSLEDEVAAGSCTDAQLLAADAPKKIGESWPANRTCFIETMKGALMAGDPDQAQATVKLAGVEDHEGRRCFRLELRGELHWADIPQPLLVSPLIIGANVRGDTTTKLEATELLPIEAPMRELLQEHQSETVTQLSITRNGKTGTAEIRVRTEDKFEQRPLAR